MDLQTKKPYILKKMCKFAAILSDTIIIIWQKEE